MTDFEKKVYKEVLKIPLGETRTYKQIAEKIKAPRACRAVAQALAKNPFPLFVPCHRVVPGKGGSGGYFLGKGLKKELINLEQKIKDMLK